MTWRSVLKPATPLTKGLAIGFGVNPDLDDPIRKALPGWAIQVTSDAPRSPTFTHYAEPRKLTGVPRIAPVIVFGFGDGALTVRAFLIGRFVDVWAHAAFGLTDPAGAVDEGAAWKVQAWASAAERARKGQGGPLAVTALDVTRVALGPVLGLGDAPAGAIQVVFAPAADPRHVAGAVAMLAKFATGPAGR